MCEQVGGTSQANQSAAGWCAAEAQQKDKDESEGRTSVCTSIHSCFTFLHCWPEHTSISGEIWPWNYYVLHNLSTVQGWGLMMEETMYPWKNLFWKAFRILCLLCSRYQCLGNCGRAVCLTWMWEHWAFLWQWRWQSPTALWGVVTIRLVREIIIKLLWLYKTILSLYHAHRKALWVDNFYHLSVKMEDRSNNRYPSLSSITNGEKIPKIKT